MPSDTIEGKYQRLAINNIDIPIDNPMSMGEALNIMDAIKGKISMNRLGADYQKTAKDLVDKFGKKDTVLQVIDDYFLELDFESPQYVLNKVVGQGPVDIQFFNGYCNRLGFEGADNNGKLAQSAHLCQQYSVALRLGNSVG